ncbi:MAG TPA: DUF2752 domain-containing protein [Mucilaginibacter sp.]|jgi:hypothetical protein|nr:DUF2752 domain-containing protein [Mucilaginibacter sp.]
MINTHVYKVINWVFAGLFSLIFVYSGIYAPNQNFPVKCYYEIHYHRPCPSCGLSRGFSAIMRGDFEAAKKFNQNSIPVFCFFSVQLFLRLLISFFLIKMMKRRSFKLASAMDVALSSLMFLWAFHSIMLTIVSADIR